MMDWPLTKYADILEAVNRFDIARYAATRNFIDGDVSRLSPYISRGVISTKMVFDKVVAKNPDAANGKFVQELLWRDYFQRLLQAKPTLSETPIREVFKRNTHGLPTAILNAATRIHAIDKAIADLYETGYMHNHLRMYVAAICCNTAQCDFVTPAQWMYYHLLDADMASNYASWQWVAGHLTQKVYVANQENIDRYSKTSQPGTFLDTGYEELLSMPIPGILSDYSLPKFETLLPDLKLPQLNANPVLLYTIYNLDPLWNSSGEFNRILILEPSHFRMFPISEKVLRFILDLAGNIPGIKIFSGEFSALQLAFPHHRFIAKEHPRLTFEGAQTEQREWIVPEVEGYFPSFSKYYSKCQKYLNHEK